MVLLTLLRVVFWAVFRSSAESVAGLDLAQAFYLGLKFDLRLCLLLLLPAIALAGVSALNPVRSVWARRLWTHHFTLLATLLVAIYAVDLGNYAYLGERIDASFVRYFHNPLISLQMVWETYPVVWGAAGAAVFALVFRLLMLRLTPEAAPAVAQPSRRRRTMARALVVFATVAYVAGLYGKISHYPLRWSDAFFSAERFVSDVALNPILFFVDTMNTVEQEVEYDLEAVKAANALVADYLGVNEPNPESLSFARRVRPTPLGQGRPNVVLILAESFGAHHTGAFGNPLNPSPNFDRLASDSMLFTNFYTPRHGTARAVFATLTGIPDTITHRTASRNPRTVTHQLVLSALEGYEKYYFLGGSANWANIRALFSHNLDDVTLIEEGSFKVAQADVWGITDYDLFEAANDIMSEVEDKPFFAFIHLSGNHRPYTVPDGFPGFEKVDVDEALLRENGFESVEEFNSFRFLDFAVGHYFAIAPDQAYFDNTLFFFLSDNGAAGHSPHMPASEEIHRLGIHHAPLTIYGPSFIPEGRVIDTPATQMDILPTIAGALGISAVNTTLGHNLLDPRFDDRRFAFIYRKRGSEGEIGLLGDQYLALVNRDGSDARLHSLNSADPRADLGDTLPDQLRQMTELGLGLYHVSKFLLYNNQPSRYEDLAVESAAPDTPEQEGN